MSALGNKEIMAQNIKRYMTEQGLDRKEFCNSLGFAYSTVTDWLNAEKYPRIDKIEAMANFFGVSKAALVEPASTIQSLTIKEDCETAHSKRDMNDLAKFLNKAEVMFDGDTYCLNEDDQQKLRNALEFVFWDAKKRNKEDYAKRKKTKVKAHIKEDK